MRALKDISKYGSLEKMLEELDTGKFPLPDPFPFDEARQLFRGAPPQRSPCMPQRGATAWNGLQERMEWLAGERGGMEIFIIYCSIKVHLYIIYYIIISDIGSFKT